MSAALIVVMVIAGAVATVAAARWLWCRRHPAPLRGDWWPDFERDFRRWAASRPPSERHRRSPRGDAL
jgi:hypothetical protein